MNKKFFAALASATMAFTASGSIAVFADDFVEENNVVKPGDLEQIPTKIMFTEENFGALAKDGAAKFYANADGTSNEVTLKNGTDEATDIKTVKVIKLQNGFDGEIKGLEYFNNLVKFDDSTMSDLDKTVTNKTLDFSANTLLEELTLTKATKLSEINLPKPEITKEEKEVYHLETLALTGTQLTDLDLSKQESLANLTVNSSKLGKLDLSALDLNKVEVTKNYNLKEVVLNNGRKGQYETLASLDLQNNALETINLDYVQVTGDLKLGGNYIGALDLSKATAGANSDLGKQTFYVYEKAANVNLKEAFSNLDVEKVEASASAFDKKTGVLDFAKATEYTYETDLEGATTSTLTVKLQKANPMNRLYNPNSGEHFYTADLKEKEALVKLGWNDEGYGWVAPKFIDEKTVTKDTDQPVYRLYNPNAGDHHYTKNKEERNTLVAYGWKDEGIGWYSAESTTDNTPKVDVYRQYNPFANGAGSHNYTTDKAENDYLVSLGWTPEGTAWYAYR